MRRLICRLLHRLRSSEPFDYNPTPGVSACDCKGVLGCCGPCDGGCYREGIR